MPKNTVGGNIEKQDPEAFQQLQSMLNRPALYIGVARFDYIDFLFSGYCWGRTGHPGEIDFLPSRELQYWLLHTQSASLRGTIQGAALFYRCFGSRNTAFENYKAFFNAPLPADCEIDDELYADGHLRYVYRHLYKVDDELYAYEYAHNTIRYDREEDTLADHYIRQAQSVGTNIKEMLEKAALSYDEIKIYVHKETLFNQVRFLFHGSDGWTTDSQIIARPEYHTHLLAMHANARNTTAEALRHCGYDVFEGGGYENLLSFHPFHDMFSDDMTFFSAFNRWKDKQLMT